MRSKMYDQAGSVKQRFATRKLKIGVVSVLIGFSVIFGAPAVGQVSSFVGNNVFSYAEAEAQNNYEGSGYTIAQAQRSKDIAAPVLDVAQMYYDYSLVPTKADIQYKELSDSIEWTITFNQAKTPNMRSGTAPEGYTSKPWFTFVLGGALDFVPDELITIQQGGNSIGSYRPSDFYGSVSSPIRSNSLQHDSGVNLDDKMVWENGIYGTEQYKEQTALREAIKQSKNRAVSVQYDGIADQTKPVTFTFKTNKAVDKESRVSAIYSSYDKKYTQQVVNSISVSKNPNYIDSKPETLGEKEHESQDLNAIPGYTNSVVDSNREAKADTYRSVDGEFTYPDNKPILLEKKDSTDIQIIIPDINQIKDGQGIEVRTTAASTEKPSWATWKIPPLFRIVDLKTNPKLINTYNFEGNGTDLFNANIGIEKLGKNLIITVKDAKLSNMVKKGDNSYFNLSVAPYKIYAVVGEGIKDAYSNDAQQQYDREVVRGLWINDDQMLNNPAKYNLNASDYSQRNTYRNYAQELYVALDGELKLDDSKRVKVQKLDQPTEEEINQAKEVVKEYLNSKKPNSVKEIAADDKGIMKVTFVDGSTISNINTLSSDTKDTINVKDVKRDFMMRKTEDSDGDGLSDELERKIGSDPYNPDTDGDGKADGTKDMPELGLNGHELDNTNTSTVGEMTKYNGTDPRVGIPDKPHQRPTFKKGEILTGKTLPYKTVAINVDGDPWAIAETVADAQGNYTLEVGKKLVRGSNNKYGNNISFKNLDTREPNYTYINIGSYDEVMAKNPRIAIWSDGSAGENDPLFSKAEELNLNVSDSDYYDSLLVDPVKVLVKDDANLTDDEVNSIIAAVKKANDFASIKSVAVEKTGDNVGKATITYNDGSVSQKPFTKDKTVVKFTMPAKTTVEDKTSLKSGEITKVKQAIINANSGLKTPITEDMIKVINNGTATVQYPGSPELKLTQEQTVEEAKKQPDNERYKLNGPGNVRALVKDQTKLSSADIDAIKQNLINTNRSIPNLTLDMIKVTEDFGLKVVYKDGTESRVVPTTESTLKFVMPELTEVENINGPLKAEEIKAIKDAIMKVNNGTSNTPDTPAINNERSINVLSDGTTRILYPNSAKNSYPSESLRLASITLTPSETIKAKAANIELETPTIKVLDNSINFEIDFRDIEPYYQNKDKLSVEIYAQGEEPVLLTTLTDMTETSENKQDALGQYEVSSRKDGKYIITPLNEKNIDIFNKDDAKNHPYIGKKLVVKVKNKTNNTELVTAESHYIYNNQGHLYFERFKKM